MSTLVSAAMSTTSAPAISPAVRAFWAPTEPWVSTLMVRPRALAPVSRPSAAMKVWAMPVGHEVTATTSGWPWRPWAPGAGTRPRARARIASGVRIAASQPTSSRGLPRKRPVSTLTSAATITASAKAMSSSRRTLRIPREPWVSTLMVCPERAAACSRASAASRVWATPVGHAVTAAIRDMVCLLRAGG